MFGIVLCASGCSRCERGVQGPQGIQTPQSAQVLTGSTATQGVQGFLESKGEKACTGDILSGTDLINMNPSDTEGKCFDIHVVIFQKLGPNTALYTLGEDRQKIVYVDFGQNPAPTNKKYMISFVARGIGTYQYPSDLGGVNIVPMLKWIGKGNE